MNAAAESKRKSLNLWRESFNTAPIGSRKWCCCGLLTSESRRAINHRRPWTRQKEGMKQQCTEFSRSVTGPTSGSAWNSSRFSPARMWLGSRARRHPTQFASPRESQRPRKFSCYGQCWRYHRPQRQKQLLIHLPFQHSRLSSVASDIAWGHRPPEPSMECKILNQYTRSLSPESTLVCDQR